VRLQNITLNQKVQANHLGYGGEIITGATGGWIKGGIPGRDSVPLLAMQDEFLVQTSATQALVRQYGAGVMETINAGRLPANVVPFPAPITAPVLPAGAGAESALLARVDRLTAIVDQQTKIIERQAREIASMRQELKAEMKAGFNALFSQGESWRGDEGKRARRAAGASGR
jgi:hypothetical protein